MLAKKSFNHIFCVCTTYLHSTATIVAPTYLIITLYYSIVF